MALGQTYSIARLGLNGYLVEVERTSARLCRRSPSLACRTAGPPKCDVVPAQLCSTPNLLRHADFARRPVGHGKAPYGNRRGACGLSDRNLRRFDIWVCGVRRCDT